MLLNVILQHLLLCWVVLEILFQRLIAHDLLFELKQFLVPDSFIR